MKEAAPNLAQQTTTALRHDWAESLDLDLFLQDLDQDSLKGRNADEVPECLLVVVLARYLMASGICVRGACRFLVPHFWPAKPTVDYQTTFQSRNRISSPLANCWRRYYGAILRR